MTKKKIAIVSIAMISMAAGSVAIADRSNWRVGHSWGHGHSHDISDMNDRIVNRLAFGLGLSVEQESQVSAIVEESTEKLDLIRKERQGGIAELIKSESISADDVEELLDFSRPTDEAKAVIAEGIAGIHGVLTPAQREQAGEYISDGWNWFHGFKNRRGGDRDGNRRRSRRDR